MKFQTLNEKEFLNPYYRKKPILDTELKEFINILKAYKKNLEDNLKNGEDALVANALKPFFEALTFKAQAKSTHKGNSGIDLALKKEDFTQVLIEAKVPHSKEFFSPTKPSCKALHECILYYLRERKQGNSSLKYLIITDFYRFYIFKARSFEEFLNENKILREAFENFENKNSLFKGNTDEIYKEFHKLLTLPFTASKEPLNLLAKNSTQKSPELKGLFIDLKPVLEQENPSFSKLKPLFKIFNKACLLDEFNPNDANLLNNAFYKELLYILGLCESKQSSKLIITKSEESKEGQGTFYTAINSKLEEENFENILQFLILWLNRILFLKLIESNLVRFNDDKNLKFLSFKKIPDFDKLSELFFEILAKEERKIKSEFAYLPYLNSSLFEKQDIEKNTLEISSLSNDLKLTYYKFTILKDKNYKTKKGQVGLLEYLFEFLDSFDFGSDDEQSEILSQKELISSSVLGNVFEKLNGYKEGSFYTPSFITSYMCKENITKIVLDKFNAKFDLNAKDIKELKSSLRKEDKKTQKELLNSIKICDPAVGSGHFLVSALNVMLGIYDELNLFEEGFYLEVQNDELLITNQKGEFIEYKRPKRNTEAHLIQKELFDTKKNIIENNLFGVDINPNSCEITKLRLWIELLKHSYYEDFDDGTYHNLKTLPNIDINIKCGNSLLSKMPINEPLHLQTQQDIKKYKKLEEQYYDGLYENKEEHIEDINTIKNNFIKFYIREKYKKELNKLYEKYEEYAKNYGKFALDELPLKYEDMKTHIKAQLLSMFSSTDIDKVKAKEELEFLKKSYDEIYSGFEWRVEFSKILYSSLSQEEITQNNQSKQQGNFKNLHKDKEGDFQGFDLVIGNPPYIRQEEIKELKPHLAKHYEIYKGTSDIYTYFYELGFKILANGGGGIEFYNFQ